MDPTPCYNKAGWRVPMGIILYLVNVILLVLVLTRLLLTNHWTQGKKLLVGLVGALTWYQVVVLTLTAVGLYCVAPLSYLYLLPFTVMLVHLTYCIYKENEGI